MLFRLVRPVKRAGSRNRQFVQRIPVDVREKAIGRTTVVSLSDDETVSVTVSANAQTIRFSLRASEPAEVKRRQARAASALEAFWQGLRQSAPIELTHKQATALSGRMYFAWADMQRGEMIAVNHAPTPENPRAFRVVEPTQADWEMAAQAGLQMLKDTEDASPARERFLGELNRLIDRLLLEEGIGEVTLGSRDMLLKEFQRALCDAFENNRRNAEGDYTPDPKSQRFPEWVPPGRQSRDTGNTVSLLQIVEDWWNEAQKSGRKPSTYESYRNTAKNLKAFLKHDDASRITPQDIVRFKDHRLEKASPKTVKDSDLAGLKTIFGWAVANFRIKSNPAQGVTLKLGKKPRLRSKGFTDVEAKAILKAAWTYTPSPLETARTAAAKRWVPWIMAYTGARVGEIAQLRKQDVRREGDLWIIHITPDAGTVKTNEARDVVLHPHLIELGFPAFASAAPQGHLFLRPGSSGDIRGPLRGLKNRLTEFVRDFVQDRNVMPNHGWRHRFKTIGREVGIDKVILDVIEGHIPTVVADGYGDVTLKAQANAMAKFPRMAAT